MDFQNLVKVEHQKRRVLTTEQLAEFYGCTIDNIKKNFNVNKDRFIEGKHYFKVEGEELKNLRVTFSNLQISAMTRTLYLWTKLGAARHAKMLSTERAWEVFEILEDTYFRVKEKIETASQNASAVQNQPLLKSTIANIAIKDAVSIMNNMKNGFGVKHGIAMAKALSIVERLNEIELPEIKELIPPAEHDIGYLTPTQIGKDIGKSAQYVNKKLVELGFQKKDGQVGYILTDAGKEYGEAMPFERNGHAGYQIKWASAVTKLFA